MDGKVVLVVSLWLKGDVEAFEAFERRASAIMAEHGGRIERAVRLEGGSEGDPPFEIHIVSFPDRDAFDAYRGDSRTAALAESRDRVVARTEVRFGRDVRGY